MRFNSQIHSRSHYFKSILGKIEWSFVNPARKINELIVVNYHSTPEKFNKNFEEQVQFFLKHFNVISPAKLSDYFSHDTLRADQSRCSLLFTFDDGLKNNIHALDILEKYGIEAFLFVVPEFINTAAADQKAYYLENIRPIVNSSIDFMDEDFTALSWMDLSGLLEKGHAVGSHTYTHTLLTATTNEKNSFREIVLSKQEIEKKLNVPISSFCSINNTSLSVGATEKKLISENYQYHFTTFPGLNSLARNPQLIFRRNIESFWPRGSVLYALGDMDLKRWQKRISDYQAL